MTKKERNEHPDYDPGSEDWACPPTPAPPRRRRAERGARPGQGWKVEGAEVSKYTLTIRGLESRDEARKIAEDYFGEMIWKRETGCMTCWPQRDEHPLTITDSDADGKVVADLHAEVRRLRREANDVFECADGTVAKDATVAAQTWADECRRLREREAKARELMERIIRDASVYYDVGMYIPDATRWLAEGE